jgi:cyclophilin family peptidyl-prolyl cis-trans isomerase
MKRLGRFEPLESRRLFAVSVLNPLPDVAVATDAPAATISLAGRFDDTDVGGTIVRFDVNSPAPANSVFVELFDKAAPGRSRVTPVTTTNFLKYVDGGEYANTFIHRSMPGFVVQGGGFKVTGTTSFNIGDTASFGTIVNEPGTVGSTNVRGTIAMAKLGGNPNSASNQWFFNLADNNDPLNPNSLDNQNGGFTTFGRVLGGGMSVIDALAAVPRFRYNSPYETLPLRNVPGAQPTADDPTVNKPVDIGTLRADQFVAFPAISRVGELVYSVSTTSPSLVTPTLDANGGLRLAYAPAAAGSATVTVRATSVFDATRFVEDSFAVTVTRPVSAATNAIIGRSGNELVISRLAGGTTLVTAPLATLPANGWGASLAGDFDGNGRSDLAAQAADGTWWVTLTPPFGPAAAARAWGAPPTGFTWRNVMVGDFDANGKDDIAAFNTATNAWRVLLSNGSAFTSVRFGTLPTADAWTNVRVGDFDADGRSDIVSVRQSDATVWVSRSTGTAFVTSQWQTLPLLGPWENGQVGDFNGDGRVDLAVRNAANGFWRLLGSTGTAFTSVRLGAWDTASAWDNVRSGDFDGDGKADLVGRRVADDTWWLARSTGTALAIAHWQPLPTGQSWQFCIAGDFNGDGRGDLAIRNVTTGVWRMLRFNGSALVSSRIGEWATTTPWASAVGVRG